MSLGIAAREITIGQLFSPGEEMIMPPYQRSYSWGEKEAGDLLGDLREAAVAGESHFLGAIVVVQPSGTAASEIVDGQQRLTTLTIMLAVLRDLEKDEAEKARIHALIGDSIRPMLGEEAKWRLQLNHIDGPFFRAMIQQPGATLKAQEEPGDSESQGKMTRNIAVFAKTLKELPPEERRALFNTIKDSSGVVRARVADRDGGYKVFRVLNTRGKEPNAHDIIKTDLFERAGFSVDEADEQSRIWAEHEALLGGSGFDDLLRQIRFIHDRSNKGDLVSGYRKSTLGRMSPRTFLDKMLPTYVRAYSQISRGRIEIEGLDETVNRYLTHLRTLDHHMWRAPALKFLVEYMDAPDMLPDFFRHLERLGFLMQLVVLNREQRNKRYRKVIDAIDVRKPINYGSRLGPFPVTKDEARKMRERLLGRFATFGQRRALALRVNTAFENGEVITPEIDATVEHVLPRNPEEGSHWLTVWPNTANRRDLCDTIGNFTLLPHNVNQAADRMTYQDKHKVYFSGSGGEDFALTRDIKSEDLWTAETVRRRTERLTDMLCRDWGLAV